MEAIGEAKEALRDSHDENRGEVLQGQQLFRLPGHPEVFVYLDEHMRREVSQNFSLKGLFRHSRGLLVQELILMSGDI